MPAIVTLTPAPVLDRIYVVPTLNRGKVNRASTVHEYMSGKALNVARSLRLAGSPVAAVLPIGREDQNMLFRSENPEIVRVVPVDGRVRVNTGIVEADGTTTNVNQRAEPITEKDWEHVVDLTIAELHAFAADWLVVSGRHPQLAGTDSPVDFTRLFETAQSLGIRVAVDASGPALNQWGQSPLVNLIKPNADELTELTGVPLTTIGDALDAGRRLVQTGLEIALISLGADGALVVTEKEEWWAGAEAPVIVNTTGAGDASLAGYLHSSLPANHRPVLNDPLPELNHSEGIATAV